MGKIKSLSTYIVNMILILAGVAYWALALQLFGTLESLIIILTGLLPAFIFVLMILDTKIYNLLWDSFLGMFLFVFSMVSLMFEVFFIGLIVIAIFSQFTFSTIELVGSAGLVLFVIYIIGIVTSMRGE